MKRETALVLVLVGLVLAVSVLGGAVAYNITTAETQRAELHRDEQRLAGALHTLAVSQKASTQTRVSTVTQRCDLTDLILGVLDRVHDTVDAAGFHASEKTCLAQLASVKKINAATPSPPAKPKPAKPKPGSEHPAR
jgi:Na+-transporting NADH:ubiquinone oxidoreductase subunit NqrC